MVIILHIHGQSDIAEFIAHSASTVAERLLDPADSIRLTLQWEVTAAGLGLRESGMRSGMLRKIYKDFEAELTIKHPWIIAALYNLAWMLIYEGYCPGEGGNPTALFVEAEDLLHKLYTASCASLSSLHMQSINFSSTRAKHPLNIEHFEGDPENGMQRSRLRQTCLRFTNGTNVTVNLPQDSWEGH